MSRGLSKPRRRVCDHGAARSLDVSGSVPFASGKFAGLEFHFSSCSCVIESIRLMKHYCMNWSLVRRTCGVALRFEYADTSSLSMCAPTRSGLRKRTIIRICCHLLLLLAQQGEETTRHNFQPSTMHLLNSYKLTNHYAGKETNVKLQINPPDVFSTLLVCLE